MKVRVEKRDGRIVPFDHQKIIDAINKAYIAVEGDVSKPAMAKSKRIAQLVEDYASLYDVPISVEAIQEIIEDHLMNSEDKDVARAYILYRDKRSRHRRQKSQLMQNISKKVNASDVQNQNANVDERSFGGRKGEANDELMRSLALDMVSPTARDNHVNNRIYMHDLNSLPVGEHNCFSGDTKFVTDRGVRAFNECADNQIVKILNKRGEWERATVHYYGKKPMNVLTFKAGSQVKTVVCTPDHRWVLNDGIITSHIHVGDQLWRAKPCHLPVNVEYNNWCFGYCLAEDDMDESFGLSAVVRLPNDRLEYIKRFTAAGWKIQNVSNSMVWLDKQGETEYKKLFLENKLWRYLPHMALVQTFRGFLMGARTNQSGHYTFEVRDIKLKNFIEEVAPCAGFYIWGQKVVLTKKQRCLYCINLVEEQPRQFTWELTSIEPFRDGEPIDAWCVETKTTKTFTLDGCMVTGNCLSIPFDKLLRNGFDTRQADVRPAKSVNTAFQLVAVLSQIQSLQQFGGVSATHIDTTMVPYVRLSLTKHFKDGLKYVEQKSDEKIEEIVNSINLRDKLDVADHVLHMSNKQIEELYPLAWKYAMDMTRRETYQAVEGMFHNLDTLQSRSGNQLNCG